MKDLISIIVPVYNVEDYIEECLDSILNQTYKNLEILLVDDGSTDNSGKICDKYVKKDNRFKVIHQKNSGLSESRNNAIKVSSGKYLSFVDSDDIIHPRMIEILHQELIKNKSDISICKFQNFYTKFIIKEKKYEVKLLTQEEFLKELMKDKEISDHACNKLYKKTLFKEIKFPIGKKYEDIGTTYKIALTAKKFVYLNMELYGYRTRENSIVNNLKKETLLDYLEMINTRYNDLIKIKPNMINYLDMNKVNSTTRCFLEISKHHGEKLLKDKELNEILIKELLISKKLMRKEIIKLNSLKENIANRLLIVSKKIFFICTKIFYRLK